MQFQSLVSLLLVGVATASAVLVDSLEQKREVCPPGSTSVEIVVTTEVVLFQLNINTFIEENTIINVGGKLDRIANAIQILARDELANVRNRHHYHQY